MWFRYWLRYQPKLFANFGFSFGIGPKPRLVVLWYTTVATQSSRPNVSPVSNKYMSHENLTTWQFEFFCHLKLFSRKKEIKLKTHLTFFLLPLYLLQILSIKMTIKPSNGGKIQIANFVVRLLVPFFANLMNIKSSLFGILLPLKDPTRGIPEL
jgi:hypothetical protein